MNITIAPKNGHYLAMALGIILFLFLWIFNPFHFDEHACRVIALAALMITWWVTEALPMPVVALLPIIMFPLMGIATVKETASNYGNEVIFLFLGGFILGLGIEKWNLHQRIALTIVKVTGTSGNMIILGFILATGMISMWLSNTATTMMMFPIALSVISVVGHGRDDKSYKNFSLCLMLAIAYAANFGGIATIIGTPPNAAYVSYITDKLGVEISFFDWLIVCLPVSLLLMFSLYIVSVKLLFPNTISDSAEMKQVIHQKLAALGPVSTAEKRVMIVFIGTALLWITRDLINQQGWLKLDDNSIAVFGAVMLFVVPSGEHGKKLLEWKDTSHIAWGILLLFGGGIALAGALEKAGLMGKLGEWIASFSGSNLLLLLLVVTTVSIFISEFMSNIAQVIVFAPVVTSIAQAAGFNPIILGVALTLGASCASMMPMGTPPNAIIFASGHVRMKDMMKAGLVMNLIAIVLIVFFCYFILPKIMTIGGLTD